MDRKRKLEDDTETETNNSPSKWRRHSVDFKLKVVSELRTSNFSEVSRKYSIPRIMNIDLSTFSSFAYLSTYLAICKVFF